MESYAILIIVVTLLVGFFSIGVFVREPGDDRLSDKGTQRLQPAIAANTVNPQLTASRQLAVPSGGQPNSRQHPLPIFSLRGVRKVYRDSDGAVVALNGVTIDIFAEVTALVGPSGEGKTTTLNLLGGLDSPTAGHVLVFGVPLRYQDSAAMQSYRGEIPAWIFQEMNLVSHQTALGNVALGLLCRGVARRKAMRAAMQNLELLGIAHLAKRYPSQLSRGQQQRVAIARAFTSDAKIILADEPTGSLDPATAEAVMVEFRRLSTRTGKPVVLVTHNHSLAQCYCDRVLECTRNGLRDITEQRERADADEQHRPAADLDIPNDRVERGQPAVVSSSLPCSR